MKRTRMFALILAATLGGTTAGSLLAQETNVSMTLSSTAFASGGSIPTRYTCEGNELSPPLAWQGVPPGTRSLALIVDDPDAPDPKAPKVTWVHWVLYNIPVDVTSLPEGISPAALPPGTQTGNNDWKKAAYGGPCPPIGRHRYVHKLYALDARLNLPGGANKAAVEIAMRGHILAQAELIGTYQKGR